MDSENRDAKSAWLSQFQVVTELNRQIKTVLAEGKPEDLDNLESLVKRQDAAIRALPFDSLSEQDVVSLEEQINSLRTMITELQSIFQQVQEQILTESSKLKSQGRSIGAYYKTLGL